MRHTFFARSCITPALAITALPFAMSLKALSAGVIALLSFPSTACSADSLALGCAIALTPPARRANDKRLAAGPTRLLDTKGLVVSLSKCKRSSTGLADLACQIAFRRAPSTLDRDLDVYLDIIVSF